MSRRALTQAVGALVRRVAAAGPARAALGLPRVCPAPAGAGVRSTTGRARAPWAPSPRWASSAAVESEESDGFVPPFSLVLIEARDVVIRKGEEAALRVNGDIRDAVQCLRFDGVKTALVCSESAAPSESALQGQEITKHFNRLVTSARGGGKLPEIMAELEVAPADCLYVGTQEEGLQEAKAAGMKVLKAQEDQADTVRAMEELCNTSLVNFAWTRDVYAGVLWKGKKDCTRVDQV